MVRNIWIVLGAVALISIAYATAFAVEEVHQPVVGNGAAGGAAEPTTWTVCSSGCDFTSIQAAVDAASDGDTIELGAETFYEAVTVGKIVHLLGSGADRTVITSPNDLPAITVLRGVSLVEISRVSIEDSPVGVDGDAMIRNSIIRGNGSGVFGHLYVHISDSLIVESGPGHAVHLENGKVSNCSIVNNAGLGLSVAPTGGARVFNSTIAGNAAGAWIWAGPGPGPTPFVDFRGNTIYGNEAFGVRARVEKFCDVEGGCWSSVITFAQNLLAHNGDNLDIQNYGGVFACTYNLLSDADPDYTEQSPTCLQTSLVNTDPLLLPLADNGGPTPTHALGPGSPAIDAGGEDCRPTDQRGVTRPQDGDGDGVAKCDIGAYEVDVLAVSLDIKPHGYPNSINPYSRGVIPVAILGSDTFDVSAIDVATLAFGPSGAAIAHRSRHLQDVNYDEILDLMLHFQTQNTGIVCGDESATLTGETLDGQPLEGMDTIRTVGCRVFRRPAIWMKDQDEPDTTRRDGLVNAQKR